MYDHDEAQAAAEADWERAYDERFEAEAEAHAEYLASLAHCPVCGDVMDYCQGHGELGDPDGYAVLVDHDNDEHHGCHSAAGCVEFEPYD